MVLLVACTSEQPVVQPSASPTPVTTSPRPRPTGEPSEAELKSVRLRLQKIADIDGAVALAPYDGSIYVLARPGTVHLIEGRAVSKVLDFSALVSVEGEGGALGLAFPPSGEHVYVSYTDRSDDVRLVEYVMNGDRPDAATRREVLRVKQLSQRHHGGSLVFGRDGHLWMGLGDGSVGKDPTDQAQSLSSLLGKLIRIDPRAGGGRPYRIPPDNPFRARAGARPEIYAFGLRNPWRFSFDRIKGDLWIGDVGQYILEEIDFLRQAKPGGGNFGWNRLEGTRRFSGSRPKGAIDPIEQYNHNNNRCAVIGGNVYRGYAIPALQGAYLYSDFCEGRVHALVQKRGEVAHQRAGLAELKHTVSFGEDADGELYLLSLTKGVFKIVPARS